MLKQAVDAGLGGFFREGTLHVTWPDGAQTTYGDGTGDRVGMKISDPSLLRRMLVNPDMAFGEGYMFEGLTFDEDDLDGFLRLALRNRNNGGGWIFQSSRALRHMVRSVVLRNPVGQAQKNVAHHYDLSADLYDIFLDDDRQYSCAYFTQADMSLEDAQLAKKRHIARKLCLAPGMRVLDIGCGWGGMALTLAQECDVHVTGVTLSQEQHALANERVRAAGLSDKIDIRLQDYRHVSETFDRVVSVGMFEHVGPRHYTEYFGHLDRLIGPDGAALIHTIANNGPPQITSPWIAKYIFPGGHIPSMREIAPHYETTSLHLTDIEVWRVHYADTLRHWYQRFEAREAEVTALYDETFVRMWRYYLKASEYTFRAGRQVVYQMQFARNHDAVPLTRDYIYT